MRRVISFRAGRLFGLLLLGGLLDLQIAAAQTWNGGGGDNNWTTDANWTNPAMAPPNNGSADVIFAGTTRLTPNVDVDYDVFSITFDNTAGAFTMGGNQLTVQNGVTNNSTHLQTFTNDIVLGAAQTWTAATGDVTYAGALDNGGFLLTVDGSSNTNITGIISGAGGLTKDGTGTLTLLGANTYGGPTIVNAGTLKGNTDSLVGDITNNANVTFNQIANGTYSGVIDGTGTLTVAGTAGMVLTLTGANVYSGGTIVTSGTLQAGAGNALPTNTPYTVNGGVLDLHDNSLLASSLNGTGGNITLGTLNVTTLTVDNSTSDDSFGGVISGAGKLIKMGTNTLTLSGLNTYTGGTMVSDGTLQGTTDSLKGDITNDATVTFNQSINGAYSGVMSGGGDLNKIGTGTVTLSAANTYSGATTVSAGTLSVTGSITSDATVNAVGTLSGTGTVANVINNGTVEAGVGGVGTLTATTFTNNAGATVQADITPGGSSNVLHTTGAADLTAGGTVNINAAAGSYNAGTKFTFLTAGGGVTGQFDNVVDNLPGNLEAVLGKDADSVFFTLLRNGTTYAAIARTQNQLAVGAYLDRVSPTASGDLQTVLDGINGLSDDEARSAFSQMAGPIHVTLAQLGVQNTSLVVYQVAKRLRSGAFTPGGPIAVAQSDRPSGSTPVSLVSCGPDGEPCFDGCESGCGCECCSHSSGWVLGYGMGGSARSDGNAPGISFGMGGTVAGMEHWADDCHLIGYYGGYVGTSVHTDVSHNSGINGGQFGAYVFSEDGCSYSTLLGGFEFDGYRTDRPLLFDDVDRTATSNYNGWQSFVYWERGLSFQSCMSLFQPFIAVQYIYLRQNSFLESGANSIDLVGGGTTSNSLRSQLGARMQWAMVNRNGHRTLPEVHALWLHEYLDSNTSVGTQFSPIPTASSAFSVQGLDLGRDWAVVGANLTWEMHDCWSMFLNYDLQTNERETVHVGSGGLAHMW